MKRIGNLWASVTSFGNLLGAAEAASAGKRKRPDVAAFLLDMEWELLALQRQPDAVYLTNSKTKSMGVAIEYPELLTTCITKVLDPPVSTNGTY